MNTFSRSAAWPLKPLIEVAKLQRGFDLPIQDREVGEVPILAANGAIGFHSTAICNGPGVITGRSGTIGKVHFVEKDYWPLNTALFVVDFCGNYPKWVYHMLSAFGLERFAQGAGVPTLNRNLVHCELVPLPPIKEQIRIAAILDKADSLMKMRKDAILLANEFLSAVFIEMFGDPVSNPKGWNVQPLGNVCSKIGSGATPKGGDASYKDDGIALIRSMNVRDGYFLWKDLARIDKEQADRLSNVVVQADDVLINITGASVARVCRAPKDVVPARVNQHVSILRPKQEVLAPFLEHLLLSNGVKSQLLRLGEAGATRQAITKSELDSFLIIIPPKVMQDKFGKIQLDVVQFIDKVSMGLDAAHQLAASLKSNFFDRESN